MTARVVACKRCGGHTDTVGRLSARKLCHGCASAAMLASYHQLGQRSGPIYDRWRRGVILALLNLDTPTSTSLDLISDDVLAELLSGDHQLVQH